MSKIEEKKRERYYASPYYLPPECDHTCLLRPCLNKYEDKGSFSVGRGYTNYSDRFQPACGTRLSQGCPDWRDRDDDDLDVNKAYAILADPDAPSHVQTSMVEVLKRVRNK